MVLRLRCNLPGTSADALDFTRVASAAGAAPLERQAFAAASLKDCAALGPEIRRPLR